MNLGFPAQERLTQNALTVGVRCVNRTRKHAASVTAYSVLRACPSIQCSTRSLHQQTTGTFGNEKLPEPLSCEERGGCRGPQKRYANNAKCGVIITRIGKPRISSAEKFPRE